MDYLRAYIMGRTGKTVAEARASINPLQLFLVFACNASPKGLKREDLLLLSHSNSTDSLIQQLNYLTSSGYLATIGGKNPIYFSTSKGNMLLSSIKKDLLSDNFST